MFARRAITVLCYVCTAILLQGFAPLFAQSDPGKPAVDKVWLQPRVSRAAETESWFPPAIQKLQGQVQRFDAKSLELVLIGEVIENQYAPERVIWISPEGFEQLEGPMVELYRDGKFAESLGQLRSILEQRPAVWRQQWITMLAANAAWKSGRSEIALNLVSQLDRRPLPPMVSAWLPIAWKRGGQPADALSAAESRLSDPSESVRLVAASWLLSSPKRSESVAVVKQLVTSQRRDIAILAEALQWRMASPPQVKQMATQWEQRLNQMPMVYQPGPTKALADLFQAAGLTEDAKRLNWAMELTPIHPKLHP